MGNQLVEMGGNSHDGLEGQRDAEFALAGLVARDWPVHPEQPEQHGFTEIATPSASRREVAEHPNLQSAPIVREWVRSGHPQAHSVELSPGGRGELSCGLWSCSAGEFEWRYASDEVIRILGGAATIAINGIVRNVRAGDVVTFRGGTTAHWRVAEYVEKFWVLAPPPTLLTRVARKLRKRRRLTSH